ncbi:MAG: hypothetical protein WDW38_006852 [Sanguina aurantia]
MAAVLVPLFEDDQGVVRVVLTQRCSNMRSHGGEVCLPGGKRDPADGGDDVVTALREAQEELGLDPATATVLLSLPPLLSKHYLSVTPVIATIPASFVPTPSPHEVAAVFTVPLELFLGTPPGHSSARTTSPQAPAAATTPGLSSDSLPALPAPATNAAAQAAPPSSSSATTPSAPAAAADAALPHSGSAGQAPASLATRLRRTPEASTQTAKVPGALSVSTSAHHSMKPDGAGTAAVPLSGSDPLPQSCTEAGCTETCQRVGADPETGNGREVDVGHTSCPSSSIPLSITVRASLPGCSHDTAPRIVRVTGESGKGEKRDRHTAASTSERHVKGGAGAGVVKTHAASEASGAAGSNTNTSESCDTSTRRSSRIATAATAAAAAAAAAASAAVAAASAAPACVPARLSVGAMSSVVGHSLDATAAVLLGAPAAVGSAPGEVAAVLACGEAQHTWLDVEWAGISYRMHSFDHQGFRIWGLTAAILIQVACAAFNRLLTGDVVLLEMSASPA